MELRNIDGGCRLGLKVQPGARRDALTGWHDGRLKVSLSAPPVDGKANEALVRFLAKLFGVTKGSVTLVRGETNREKTIDVWGVSADHVRAILRREGIPSPEGEEQGAPQSA